MSEAGKMSWRTPLSYKQRLGRFDSVPRHHAGMVFNGSMPGFQPGGESSNLSVRLPGAVAQLAECRPVEPDVAGSSPVCPVNGRKPCPGP